MWDLESSCLQRCFYRWMPNTHVWHTETLCAFILREGRPLRLWSISASEWWRAVPLHGHAEAKMCERSARDPVSTHPQVSVSSPGSGQGGVAGRSIWLKEILGRPAASGSLTAVERASRPKWACIELCCGSAGVQLKAVNITHYIWYFLSMLSLKQANS